MANQKSGYIYLAHLRESCENNETIYKIGRTNKENFERFKSYPKGTDILLHIKCVDCVSVEKKLIHVFNEKFNRCERCILYGKEYFNGDKFIMMQVITQHLDYACSLENTSKVTKMIDDLIANEKRKHETTCHDYKNTIGKLESEVSILKHNLLYVMKLINDENVNGDEFDHSVKFSINSIISKDEDTQKESEEKNKVFQCNMCSKILSTNYGLKIHKLTCKSVHSLQCPKCKKEFRTAQTKHYHLKNVQCTPINDK